MSTLRLSLASFACLFVLAASWVLSSPLLSVPDEKEHLAKSAAVVRGELSGRKLPIPDEGPEPTSREAFTVIVPVPYSYTWQTLEIPSCFIYSPDVPAGCAPTFEDHPEPAEWMSWVGQYPPTYYAAVGWPTLLDTGRLGVYLVRLVSAAICAALVAVAIGCAAVARRQRLVAIGVVIAVTPMSLFLAGGINPNGPEVAAAICFWTAFGSILTLRGSTVPRFLYVAGLVSGLAIIASRPLSVLWLVLAAAVLLVGFDSPRRLLRRLGLRRALVATGVLATASALTVIWVVSHDSLGNVQGQGPLGLGFLAALRNSIGRTPYHLRQMVGIFGWSSTPPPVALFVLWAIALAIVVVIALVVGRNRTRLAVLVAIAGAVGLPVLMEALQAHDRGFPWQGRYGLPLAVGVPITAVLAIIDGRPLRPRAITITVWVVLVLTTIGQVLAHAAAMRRYVVGSDGPWWYLTSDGWDPPIPSWLLLLMVVAGALGLAAVTLRITVGPDDDPDDRSVDPLEPTPATSTSGGTSALR